jgi:hypothetical protein
MAVRKQIMPLMARESKICDLAIRHLTNKCNVFENKYNLSSKDFYERFHDGKLGDDEDMFEWKALLEGILEWKRSKLLIDAYFDELEKTIINDPLVVCIELHRTYTSPKTAYIKGEITFTDGTSMAFFQHIRIEEADLIVTDYRYHCMAADNKLIFRYDNAPHYSEVATFPHHKHLPSGIYGSDMPDLKDVLAEIDVIVIEKLTIG